MFSGNGCRGIRITGEKVQEDTRVRHGGAQHVIITQTEKRLARESREKDHGLQEHDFTASVVRIRGPTPAQLPLIVLIP